MRPILKKNAVPSIFSWNKQASSAQIDRAEHQTRHPEWLKKEERENEEQQKRESK